MMSFHPAKRQTNSQRISNADEEFNLAQESQGRSTIVYSTKVSCYPTDTQRIPNSDEEFDSTQEIQYQSSIVSNKFPLQTNFRRISNFDEEFD